MFYQNETEMKIPSLEQFKKTFSKANGKPESRFFAKYGNVSFEEAYPLYVESIISMFNTSDKISAFEKFLINKGINAINSNISESRYYRYNGIKYRFSSHIYPTGSMTNETCVDFAANPELIHKIIF